MVAKARRRNRTRLFEDLARPGDARAGRNDHLGIARRAARAGGEQQSHHRHRQPAERTHALLPSVIARWLKDTKDPHVQGFFVSFVALSRTRAASSLLDRKSVV